MPSTPPGGHTIAVVAERTGLSRDVLRVWERRYRVVEPRRSAGGQRLYTDEELARFQILARATRFGRSIGSVVGLSTGQLVQMLAADQAVRGQPDGEPSALPPARPAPSAMPIDRASAYSAGTVERALAHAIALDSARLDGELRWALARFGLPLMLEEIVPALMHRIGDEWMARRLGIPHEHLASGVVLGMLLDAIRAIPEAPDAPRLLVATPAGEQHVIGAALMAAAAAIDGWSILYLGADVPAADLASAALGREARAVALSIVLAPDDERVIHEIRMLRATLPAEVRLLVGGAAALRLGGALELPGVDVCRDLQAARSVLGALVEGG